MLDILLIDSIFFIYRVEYDMTVNILLGCWYCTEMEQHIMIMVKPGVVLEV
jgi:hypothetical protein